MEDRWFSEPAPTNTLVGKNSFYVSLDEHLLGFGSIKKKRDGKNNGIQISKEIISGSLFSPSLYFPT
jgi:hypothetical protein